ASELEQDLVASGAEALVEAPEHRLHQCRPRWRVFVPIADAEAAAKVDVAQFDAVRAQVLDEVGDAVGRGEEWRDLGDLRADVTVDPDHLDSGQAGRSPIRGAGAAVGDAELALSQPRGDIGV